MVSRARERRAELRRRRPWMPKIGASYFFRARMADADRRHRMARGNRCESETASRQAAAVASSSSSAASGAGASGATKSTSLCLCQTALPIIQRMLGADKAVSALYHRRREHVAAALFIWRLSTCTEQLEQRAEAILGRLPPSCSGLAGTQGQYSEGATRSGPDTLMGTARDAQIAAAGADPLAASDCQLRTGANGELALREALRRAEMSAESLRASEQCATKAQWAAEQSAAAAATELQRLESELSTARRRLGEAVEAGAAAAATSRETTAAWEARVHTSEAEAAQALAARDKAVEQVGT